MKANTLIFNIYKFQGMQIIILLTMVCMYVIEVSYKESLELFCEKILQDRFNKATS